MSKIIIDIWTGAAICKSALVRGFTFWTERELKPSGEPDGCVCPRKLARWTVWRKEAPTAHGNYALKNPEVELVATPMRKEIERLSAELTAAKDRLQALYADQQPVQNLTPDWPNF
jgi:hypothetical protein